MPRFTRSRFKTFPATQNLTGSPPGSGRDYRSEQTAQRRHEFIAKIPGLQGITLGAFATVDLAQFHRSFGDPDIDDPPTATASNNYQSANVMNGSAIKNFSAQFKFMNTGSSEGFYVDVYEVITSFSESLYMNQVYNTECPIEFLSSPGNAQGNVQFKDVLPTWTENIYKNFKGLQRNIHFLGTVFVSSEDGGTPEASFIVSRLPGKCRRSQTGMFYGMMFHYSSTKNTAATASIEASVDISFDEIPSSERVPYKW